MNNTASELNLPDSHQAEPAARSYRSLLPLLAWSSLAGTSLFFSLQNLQAHSIELSLAQGRALFHLVEATQIWNTEHGGIYVLQTGRDLPNPYLNKSIRSAATITGRPLTLINCSYMTRQISGVIERESGIRLHLTSLAPINPENKADAWETRALQAFESGAQKEGLGINAGIARYMAPLYIKSACMACHKGYKPGDVRGGLSVQWSVMPIALSIRHESYRSIATHTATWLLISIFMFIAVRRLMNNKAALAQSRAALSSLNADLDTTVNTRVKQLLASMHTLRSISNHAPGIVYQYLLRPDESSAIPYANDQLFVVFGLHPEEVHDSAARFIEHIHPDDVADFISSTRFSARDLTPWQHEFRIIDRLGRERWLFGDTIPQRRENGLTLWHGFITDITQRKRAEAQFRQHKVIIDTAQDGFWMVDTKGNLQEVNQAYADMTGYSIEELLKMHVSDLEVTEQSDEIKAHIDTLFTVGHDVFETRHRHKDGHLIDVEMSATFMREFKTFFVFCRDITRRKEFEKALQESENRYRHLADYDVLTKLPNRRLLADRLGAAQATSQRSGCFGALMLLDLDNFKPLNDQHGHDMGDLLLLEVADRLKKCVREVDTVARIGGDEFVVVLTELDQDRQKSNEQAHQIAEKIRTSLSAPYELPQLKDGSHVTHHCSASIGVALFAGHEYTQAAIFKCADTAMYQAKNTGRNQIRFHQRSAIAESNVNTSQN
ncbi:MAG: diguanylate cyclase [Gallionella sp.]|jgi:diguanylate cyclase (GGDEF)-like protein/PAS domain S-box-containing protein